MKKKLLLAGAVALMAAAAVTGYSVYNKTKVSDLLSANVEALARWEIDPVEIVCSNIGCHYCYSEQMAGIRFWCEWEGATIWYCKFC